MDHTPILAERVDGTVVVHDRAAEVRWDLGGLIAADGHVLGCRFACRVRALPDPTETRMLAEALLAGRQHVQPVDVERHFAPVFRTALGQLVPTRSAEAWLAAEAQATLREAMIESARATAFANGLEVLAPFEFSAESPTLAQQRVESLQRARAEERAQRRQRTAERAAAALAAAGDGPPVVDVSDEQERLDYLSAMIDAAAARAPAAVLYAVSGHCLLGVDPAAPTAISTMPLPTDLGPLRSVDNTGLAGRAVLLVGAQRGLLLVDPTSPTTARLYRDPDLNSSLGFNQCLRLGDHLWACHGDGGIVTWAVDQPDAPVRIVRTSALRDAVGAAPGATPRHLCVLDEGRLLFSMGPLLCTIDSNHIVSKLDTPDPAEITAILACPCDTVGTATAESASIHVVRRNGTTTVRAVRDLRIEGTLDRAAPASAAAVLPAFGLPLRLLANERGVDCLDDTGLRLREFSTSHRNLRLLAATSRWIAALSADRQRAILWQTTTPGKPLHELHLGARTRHRVADLCWVSQ